MILLLLRKLLLLMCVVLCQAAAAEPTVHLRFVCWDGDEAQRALRPAVRDFERKYPHIRVKFESVTQNYQQKLLAQYAAGVAPDVAMMDPGNFQRFASRGALLPLNPFFGDVPGFDINTYYPEIVEPHSYKGTVYVLPRDIAPMGIVYYNKRVFREAGIPYPDGSWTWDYKIRPELREKDFLWVMRELTKKNARGKTVQWGFTAIWIGTFADMCAMSTGFRWADDYESPTRMNHDDPRLARAYQFVADLSLKEGWIPSPTEISSVLQSSSVQLFIGQKVAMFQSGIWEVPRMRESLKIGSPEFFEWDIALAPSYADPKFKRQTPTGGSGYCILSSTKHPKEAWLLTEWMAGRAGMLAMAKAGLAQPAIASMAQEAPWIPGPDAPEEQRYPANRLATHQAVPFVQFGPSYENWGELNGLATTHVESIFTGQKTASEAFRLGQKMAQRRLDEIRAERTLPNFNWAFGGGVAALALAGMIAWVWAPEIGKRRTPKQKRETRLGYLFVMPWILGMVVFTLGPMVLSLLMSLAKWDIIQPAQWRGLGNYSEALFSDPRFWVSLRVTAVYSIVAVPLGIMGSLALALLLNTKVKGISLYRACFYMPSLASAVAASLIWRRIFMPEGGLLNRIIYGADGQGDFLGLASLLSGVAPPGQPINWLGTEQTALSALIVMSLWGVGGGMVILLAGLQGIPQHYYEAAVVDGAGVWKRFRAVTLPLLSPALFFSLITGVIGSFQVFTQSFVMTGGGPNNSTRFYMLHLYSNAFDALRMGYASALAWVMFFIILLLTLFQFRLAKFVYYEGGSK